MPVRRVDTTDGIANPSRTTEGVTAHYQAAIPKDMPHGISMRLQNSITTAKGDRNETKMSFAHRTGVIGTLNDGHYAKGLDADADLLATATALKGAEKCCSPATLGKLKSCGTLTTSRAAYNDLLCGEGTDSRDYLRGTSCKPVQYHELPYGRECEHVIGPKATVYRNDYCESQAMLKTIGEGHAPGSPALLSVYTPSANLQSIQQLRTAGGLPAPPSPRGHAATSRRDAGGGVSPRTSAQQQQPPAAALGYNVYHGSELVGSEKAERAVDAQARREMDMLRASASRRSDGANAMRTVSDALLTPRTMRLQAMQREQQQALSASLNGNGSYYNSNGTAAASSYRVPQPPTVGSSSTANANVVIGGAMPKALSPTDIQNSPRTAGFATSSGSGSPRLQPIINRATMDRIVPSTPTRLAMETGSSGRGMSPRNAAAAANNNKGLYSTIPQDVSPRRVDA